MVWVFFGVLLLTQLASTENTVFYVEQIVPSLLSKKFQLRMSNVR